MFEYSQVVSGGFGTGAHLIVVKRYVHTPVQTVLDRPMRADRVADGLRIGGQTADVEASFAGSFIADGALGFEHGKATHPLPLLGLIEAFQLIEHVAAACLQPAVILLHGLGERVRGVYGRMSAEAAPEVFYRLGQFGLVVLDRQHVVGAAVLNGRGDGGLCAHGIDGDGAASQRKRGKQLRNRCNFVGFFRCGTLPENQSCSGVIVN